MSAGTLAEALIVAGRRGVDTQMNALLAQLELEIVKVSAVDAREMAEGYSRWGKGVHPARLNLGDCFAYALAKERNLPLLFVGNDFAQTDVKPALPPRPSPANPRAI